MHGLLLGHLLSLSVVSQLLKSNPWETDAPTWLTCSGMGEATLIPNSWPGFRKIWCVEAYDMKFLFESLHEASIQSHGVLSRSYHHVAFIVTETVNQRCRLAFGIQNVATRCYQSSSLLLLQTESIWFQQEHPSPNTASEMSISHQIRLCLLYLFEHHSSQTL